MTYGVTITPGKTSEIAADSLSHTGPVDGETGDGSVPYATRTSTSGSAIARRISRAASSTLEPTAIRTFTIAVARSAMTLSPALPVRRVTARVVRTIAEVSAPSRENPAVSSGRKAPARVNMKRRGPDAWAPSVRI